MIMSGTKEGELDRTAEMYVDLCKQGKFEFAFWIIHDSNRFDAASMKYLGEQIQTRMARERKRHD